MRHRHRHRNRNCKKQPSKQWATAGACLEVIDPTNLSSQTKTVTNTSLDAKTQQAMIEAIND